jgi:hypothetical protein
MSGNEERVTTGLGLSPQITPQKRLYVSQIHWRPSCQRFKKYSNVGKGDRCLADRSHALAVYGAIPDL